jgi:hypothetical protein
MTSTDKAAVRQRVAEALRDHWFNEVRIRTGWQPSTDDPSSELNETDAWWGYADTALAAINPSADEAAIRADERKRCAKVANVFADEKDVMAMESYDESSFGSYREGEQTAKQIAAAILALGPATEDRT